MPIDKDGFYTPDSVEGYLNLIWMIACDYDGYNTVDGLKSLIDEIVGYANKARVCLKENKLYEVREMNKPKLNEPDVEQTTTKPIVGVDLTKLTPEEYVKEVVDPSCPQYPLKNFKFSPPLEVYRDKEGIFIPIKTITEQEVLEEWRNQGFEIENNDKRICVENEKLNIVIYMDKISKNIQICVCHYNYAQTISFELHNLIHKTIKALEEEELCHQK